MKRLLRLISAGIFLIPLLCGVSCADELVLMDEGEFSYSDSVRRVMEWQGLFITDESSSSVAPVKVRFRRLVGGDYTFTASPAGARFLVSGIPSISSGSVVTVSRGFAIDYQNNSVDMKLNNRSTI